MSAGAAVSMAALCVSEPLTLMSGSKGSGGGSTAHSSLSCSLSLSFSLSLSSRALSPSVTHTLTHTHTEAQTEGKSESQTHTHTHTQSKEEGALRLPGRTQPGICNRSVWKEWGARVRGWDGLLRIYPVIRQIQGEKKFFPLLKRRLVHYYS